MGAARAAFRSVCWHAASDPATGDLQATTALSDAAFRCLASTHARHRERQNYEQLGEVAFLEAAPEALHS